MTTELLFQPSKKPHPVQFILSSIDAEIFDLPSYLQSRCQHGLAVIHEGFYIIGN